MIKKILAPILFLALSVAINAETLNSKTIEQWIEAYPSAAAWLANNQDLDEEMEDLDPTSEGYAEETVRLIKASGKYKEFAKVLKPYGYKAVEPFMATTMQIVGAYIAKQTKMVSQEMDTQGIGEAVSALGDLFGASEEQKSSFMDSMNETKAALEEGYEASKEDIAALEPYWDQIDALMEDGSEEEN
jgi:hypothetical protein